MLLFLSFDYHSIKLNVWSTVGLPEFNKSSYMYSREPTYLRLYTDQTDACCIKAVLRCQSIWSPTELHYRKYIPSVIQYWLNSILLILCLLALFQLDVLRTLWINACTQLVSTHELCLYIMRFCTDCADKVMYGSVARPFSVFLKKVWAWD